MRNVVRSLRSDRNKGGVTVSWFFKFGKSKAADYSEGQVWSYKTRPGEEKSTVQINKIEWYEPVGHVFHISVDGLMIKNPLVEGGISTELPHAPVMEETLTQSFTTLICAREPNPNYIEGYEDWKATFDAGSGGVFNISVAKIVDAVESGLNQ